MELSIKILALAVMCCSLCPTVACAYVDKYWTSERYSTPPAPPDVPILELSDLEIFSHMKAGQVAMTTAGSCWQEVFDDGGVASDVLCYEYEDEFESSYRGTTSLWVLNEDKSQYVLSRSERLSLDKVTNRLCTGTNRQPRCHEYGISLALSTKEPSGIFSEAIFFVERDLQGDHDGVLVKVRRNGSRWSSNRLLVQYTVIGYLPPTSAPKITMAWAKHHPVEAMNNIWNNINTLRRIGGFIGSVGSSMRAQDNFVEDGGSESSGFNGDSNTRRAVDAELPRNQPIPAISPWYDETKGVGSSPSINPSAYGEAPK